MTFDIHARPRTRFARNADGSTTTDPDEFYLILIIPTDWLDAVRIVERLVTSGRYLAARITVY